MFTEGIKYNESDSGELLQPILKLVVKVLLLCLVKYSHVPHFGEDLVQCEFLLISLNQ